MKKNFWLKSFQIKVAIVSISLALPLVVMAQTYSDRSPSSYDSQIPFHSSHSIADFANAMRWSW